MSAQRFTVEQIENTATGEQWHAGYARMQGATGAADIHDRCVTMLRAFALQTQRVEQMREWFTGICDSEKPSGYFGNDGCDGCGHDHSAHVKKQQFTALFPKEGGQ